MPLNRKWKCGILLSLLCISLLLLFIPYQEKERYGYFDPYAGISRLQGEEYPVTIFTPWRSHDQTLKILLNVSMGKVNMEIMNIENHIKWLNQEPYSTYLQYINITFFDDVLHFQPPFDRLIFILITAVVDSTINPKMWFSQLLYYNNYGLFFLSISSILGLVYLNQIIHKKFNFR